jgi:ectoine hydroxylase-related dioxygenase (phytanoyl-CoA dioxygenase family)
LISKYSKKEIFEKNGYLVGENLIERSEIIQCRREIKNLQTKADSLRKSDTSDTIENSDFQIEPFLEKLEKKRKSPILRKIENTQDHSSVFYELARHDSIVSIVEEILGPDILLFRSTLMLKPALHGSEHAFHQDASYWPMDPPTLVTVSIAIDESTRKNGCIEIIPESHVSELKQWGKIAVPPELKLPRSKNGNNQNEIYLPLLPGSALFFHSKLVHGSGPNKSIHPRNTALYTYFTPAVSYRPHNGTPSSRIFSVISGLKGAKFFEITAE